MDVVACSMDHELATPVLVGLERAYEELYGASSEMARTTADQFRPPAGLFLVGIDGGRTVAGGGYRRFDETSCEIKRVWTDASVRRRGFGSRLMEALESAAREAGYARIVLETGPLQPEAAALYLRRGYRQVPPFGPYPDDLGFELQL